MGGAVDLERETFHVMDDQRRVAMVETKTREGGAALSTPVTRWRFQLDNHLGSATLELDQAGNIIGYEEYHPYGSTAFSATSASSEVSAKRYRYTGKERDEETGLYYHGARYYAAWLGRWTATDPLGLKDGVNVYRYSRNNPIAYSDPGGTESKSFAARGSVDYKIGTSNDPQLIGYLKGLTAEQRGDFVNSATGKFRERAQAALRVGHLGSVVTVPDVTVEGKVPAAPPPAPLLSNDDPIVAGCIGGQCYLNIRQSRFEQLEKEAKIDRALRTLENVSGGPLGATGYLIGVASSDDPNVQGAASDIGALGDQVLQGAGTAEQISPRRAGNSASDRAVATQPIHPEPIRPEPAPTREPLLFAPPRPGSVTKNRLSKREYGFAKEIVAYQGGRFDGQTTSNLPGIDGTIDGVPAQLKQLSGKSPTSVSGAGKEAGVKATNAGVSGVEVFINAPGVSQEAVLAGPLGQILLQQPSLAAITVFTKDGVVRFIR
ncbi:MAG TPA: RHS repeat-associated core domain-containing protein [Polyangiaceae bacterium]|nr:RHS repeat-associated core domain-containing protein [Polyangiaceae bacterium]